MKEKLEKIREEALGRIQAARSLEELNEVRVSFLGKKGALTELLKGMKSVAPKDRPKVGQMVNEVRALLEDALEEKKAVLEDARLEEQLKKEVLDVTLPAKKNRVGHRHPNTIALEDVERIFVGMGYEVVEGPEVEKDYYNFEALNIPKDHPARDEQDTFYINDEIVLRTQTSPVQVRTMEQGKLAALLLELNTGSPLYTEVSDFCGREYLEEHLPEDMDLTELNLLAEKLASLEPVQEAAFEGLVRMDLDKGTMELPLCRLIDLANSADCCHVAPGVENDEQLGHFYVDNDFPVIPPGLPEEVYEVLDYAAIGRKARMEEGGVFTSEGYVVQHTDLDVSYSQSHCGPQMEVMSP